MPAKNMAVFCIFPHRTGFEHATCALKFAGFRETEISGLFQPGAMSVPGQAGADETCGAESSIDEIGATFGWLAEARAVHTAVDGMLLISGPLLPPQMDLEALGNTGGLRETLLAAGLPKAETKPFEERIMKGGILLCVVCRHPSWVDRATALLGSTGAENIISPRKHAVLRRLESV